MALHPEPSALLALKVQPRASADAVLGEREGLIVVRLKAPPVEGQANAALLRFLARKLGVPQRTLELVRGFSARQKWVRVLGLSTAAARQALLGNSGCHQGGVLLANCAELRIDPWFRSAAWPPPSP